MLTETRWLFSNTPSTSRSLITVSPFPSVAPNQPSLSDPPRPSENTQQMTSHGSDSRSTHTGPPIPVGFPGDPSMNDLLSEPWSPSTLTSHAWEGLMGTLCHTAGEAWTHVQEACTLALEFYRSRHCPPNSRAASLWTVSESAATSVLAHFRDTQSLGGTVVSCTTEGAKEVYSWFKLGLQAAESCRRAYTRPSTTAS